jgi:hypothetical protein
MRKFLGIYLLLALVVVSSSLLSPTRLAAEERGITAQKAILKMAKETLDCAAYFDIVSLALLHSSEGETAQKYLSARKTAVDRAESLNRGIVKDNYNSVLKDMSQTIIIANSEKNIKPDLSNLKITDISVLGDKYSKLCKEVLDDPGARARYWTEQLSNQ